MVQLTQEQHDLLQQAGDSPARIVDPTDMQEYVLISADVYARLEALVSSAEDQVVQAAWQELSRRSAAATMLENPY